MPRRLKSQHGFNAGEITHLLDARSDVEKYSKAVQTMTNMYGLGQGPARRRNGTQYISEVKTSANQARLIPFIFSADDAFVLELGDSYIRFYNDKAQVQDGGSPVEVVSPYSAAEAQDVQYVQFGDTLYLTHPSYLPRTLTRNSTTSWTIEPLFTFPPPTEELGYTPAAITMTPSATTGFSIDFTASSSVFLDGDIGRQIVNLEGVGRASIVSVTSGTVAVCDIVEDFPDTNPINGGEWKLDLSPISDLTTNGTKVGSIVNVTADIPSSTTAQDTFRSDDIGKYILMHGGVLEIIQINTASDIDCEVLKSLTSLDETGNWTLEEETWSSTRGYPRAVGFYEQRLIFGGTTAEPQSLWFSEVGLYDSFGIGANDADAIDVDIASNTTNQIEWIAAGRDLVVGTSGGESTITGSGGIITPSSIQIRARTYHGSNNQNVVTTGPEIMFVQKSGTKIRTFVFNFELDSYKAEDLLFLASHLTGTNATITRAAFAQEPDNLLYLVLSSGDMLVGQFNREQSVIGWSKYTTDGSYEDVTTISQDGEDQVWVLVNRTIDGNTVRYIEVFDSGDGSSQTDGFSDSFLTYDGASTTTLTGLDHLEGETVQVKANGAVHADKTVSGGSITLDVSATKATVGMPYTSTLKTLEVDLGQVESSSLGQRSRWLEATLNLYASNIPTLNSIDKPQRDPTMEMDQAVDLFTGFATYSTVDEPELTITISDPHPCLILGLTGIVESSF